MPDTDSWQLRDGEQVIAGNTGLLGRRQFLIGITRVRNEALVLRDTLDYVGNQVDAIVAYDDASTDRTLEILREHPKVALIVANRSWETDIEARRIAEGRHRGLLLQTAREHLPFDWMFCFDADERVTGDLRSFTEETHSSDYDGVRVELFDAYMTPDDQAPYQAGRELLDFRRFFGPERRDILMLWPTGRRSASRSTTSASLMVSNGWRPVCIASTMARHCRSNIGKRPATTTSGTFRSIPTDGNGAIVRVRRSTPNPTSCGPCMHGATRSSPTRSGSDLSDRIFPEVCGGMNPSLTASDGDRMSGYWRLIPSSVPRE